MKRAEIFFALHAQSIGKVLPPARKKIIQISRFQPGCLKTRVKSLIIKNSFLGVVVPFSYNQQESPFFILYFRY